MFGSSKKAASDIGQIETLIGKDTVLKGNISSKGTIRIDGRFEGDIVTSGSLIIGAGAVLTAQISAQNATIAGTVYGNVDSKEKLELLSTAKMYGDIHAGIVSISEGAIFKGSCEMKHGGSEAAPEIKLAAIKPEAAAAKQGDVRKSVGGKN